MLALLCVYTLRTLHSRVKSGFFNSLDVILSCVVHLDICTCLILCQLFDFRKSSSPTFSQLSCLFRFMICGQSGPCPLGTSFKCVAGASGDFLPVPLESWTSHFSRILFSSPFWRLPLLSSSQRGSWGQRSQCGHKRRVFVAPHSEHQSPESCLVIVEGDSPPMLFWASQIPSLLLSLHHRVLLPSTWWGPTAHTYIAAIIKHTQPS